jgi:hypothetical protein
MDDTLSREEELFDAARKLNDPAQRAVSGAGCDGDPSLRERVETLLSVHSQAEELFTECISALRTSADGPASTGADSRAGFEEEQPGARIGLLQNPAKNRRRAVAAPFTWRSRKNPCAAWWR